MERAYTMDLSNQEIKRYSRHLIMPEVGIEGQKKLKNARVLCIGAGGLGSPLALYLAAAGVGTLGILDFDVVDFSNLQRQVIHSEKNLGQLKVESARDRILELNSDTNIITYHEEIKSHNAMEIIEGYDVVVDGTDNFPTRYLTNDACAFLGIPNVYGSIFRFEGQVSVFYAKKGPCYRCLYSTPPPPGLVPSCAQGGVLGILPGVVGTIQASEVVKLIIGQGTPLIGKLLFLDVLEMEPRILKLRKDPDCPVCGENPTVTELMDYEQFCQIGSDRTAEEITVEDFKQIRNNGSDIVLIDVREPKEYEICKIEGSKLIPLGQIKDRIEEFNREDDIVIHCHHGGRSMQAALILEEHGFTKVKSLKGGIHEWARMYDPDMPTY